MTLEEKIIEAGKNSRIYAYSLTRNNELAEDLVQDTMLIALLNKQKIRDYTKIDSWMRKTMKNSFIDEWRKKQRRSCIEYTQEILPEFTKLQAENNYGESSLVESDLNRLIISHVSEKEKSVIDLLVKEYNYSEISEELGISYNSITAIVFRLRKKLKFLLN